MPDHFDFGDLGKILDFGPHGQAGQGPGGLGNVEFGQSEGAFALVADFEDERFANHRRTSSKAAARASMQALVLTSVTHTSRARSISG